MSSSLVIKTFAPAVSSSSSSRLSSVPRSNTKFVPAPSLRPHLRVKNATSLGADRRLPIVFASDSSSSEPTVKGKVDNSSSVVADGPPLPTILAGIVVFLLVCWVISSIVMWLIGLVVNVPHP